MNGRMLVGTLGAASPLALAEKAIRAAEELGIHSCACALRIDEHERLWAVRVNGRKVDPCGWIATFNKKSDPDWLEEEIKAVQS